MSISEGMNRFDGWLAAEYEKRGDFTILVVLVSIGEPSIELLRSSFMNVIGDETCWHDLVELFAGSGAAWNGAAFFVVESYLNGPVPGDLARSELRALEDRLREDRRVLNTGHFFDRHGRRIKVEEVDA